MDPSEERRHSKRQMDYINMLSYVADSEYGIPRRCACGGRMIDEVREKEEYDTLPGKRFFTCVNYEEEMGRLSKRLEEAEQVIKLVPQLKIHIETLEAQVKGLTRLLDHVNAEVYNLTVQVANLEKVCFE